MRAFAIIMAALLLSTGAIWCSGFFYWQISIRRNLAQLRRNHERSGKKADLDPIARHEAAGSRAIPIILRAIDDAASTGNEPWMELLIVDLKVVAANASLDPRGEVSQYATDEIEHAYSAGKAESLRKGYLGILDWWNTHREDYPAWWMWWCGPHF